MKTWVKILIGLVILGIIGAVLGYIFVYNKPHPDYDTMKPAYTVTARELYDAFKTSSDEASKKFNGQVVEVSGILSKKEMTDSTAILVFVFEQGMFGDLGVRCTLLDKYVTMAQNLTDSASVKVKGYCTGYTDDVILEQCSVIQ
jgi:hypothetical protein